MTVPVDNVGGVQEADRRGGERHSRKKAAARPRKTAAGCDSVDISQEARDRAAGKKHGNILEYLENEDD